MKHSVTIKSYVIAVGVVPSVKLSALSSNRRSASNCEGALTVVTDVRIALPVTSQSSSTWRGTQTSWLQNANHWRERAAHTVMHSLGT